MVLNLRVDVMNLNVILTIRSKRSMFWLKEQLID